MSNSSSKSSSKIERAKLDLPIPLMEFVAMMASLLALNALAIDAMLPALHNMAVHFELKNPNAQQWVVFSYIIGFGFPQLFFGPLTDRFGRKGLLQVSLIGYAICAFLCMIAPSFYALLFIRFIQGVFAAGARVIAGAVIRDLTHGRLMARILSLVLAVFIIVPIIAPGIGTLVMALAHWSWTFGILGVVAIMTCVWVQFRLPYTLPVEDRRPLNLSYILNSYGQVIKTRETFGYMAASGIIFGALFTFIGASEQIFSVVFDKGETFWLWFGVIASGLGVATLFNAQIVERVGMRRISHTVTLFFIVTSVANLAAMMIFGEVFYIFLPLFALTFACFGMMSANFASLALEPLGDIAGTASAAYGFATSTISSFIGIAIAGQFNGTVIPILVGFVILGVLSLGVIWLTERGVLFGVGEGKQSELPIPRKKG